MQFVLVAGEKMDSIRGIRTDEIPEWATAFPLGVEVGVESHEISVCATVAGYCDNPEVLMTYCGGGGDIWYKQDGRFILVRFCDGSKKLFRPHEVSAWNEQRSPVNWVSRLLCLCGSHEWDNVPRRGLLRETGFGLFTFAEQYGEQRCVREGCSASHVVARDGFRGKDAKPKWERVSRKRAEEIRKLTPF